MQKEPSINKEHFLDCLTYFPKNFLQIFPDNYKESDGWKLSIQGRNLSDVRFLSDRLYDYLLNRDISFKAITAKGLKMTKIKDTPHRREQIHKVLTIYCPRDTDLDELCHSVRDRITEYRGHCGLPAPTAYKHFSGGIFIRNDRGEDGRYVSTKQHITN
ncbi:hypothetical protein [Vibrio sp. D431a]|uniref:class III lanthionine synthetase LanKC N-terminal domain-containing protein n=1 Tax=Vibrio sp. D431a TaxID=2837388 RepID=UPI002554B60C|nr:hypothetical protein [Vibrio sp. D431a]MDK9793338.1 hypothetical protein [Vibrio sp. D431a]